MKLRTLTLATALSAGLAATPIVSAQTPRSPADPASPGAVVTPQDKAAREMQKKNDGAGNTGGSSSGRQPTVRDGNPASPRPPSNDAAKPADGYR